MKTQIGLSDNANFEDLTWTFEMQKGYAVKGGRFAIIPAETYHEIMEDIDKIVFNFPLNADVQYLKDSLVSISNKLEL